VAGQDDTLVALDSGARYLAQAVAFDRRNDVAVLRVDGLDARPLPLVDPRPGTAVAVLGYPENGPFTATPGRIGRTAIVPSEDAYGHGPVLRAITALRGDVRHGDSGAPAVDANGAVETTVFAARRGSRAGYGVPSDRVRSALDHAGGPVSTGDCSS
jgi:S1-C subfamily serine protease